MLIGSISFALVNFPIQLLSKSENLFFSHLLRRCSYLAALNGMCTYVMPAIVFLFVRKTQTAELAQGYLSKQRIVMNNDYCKYDFVCFCSIAAIPLYSFLITVLGQLLLIMEPALITVTVGDHLWTVLNRLENLEKEHKKRMEYERRYALRHDDTNRFTIEHLNISIPSNIIRIRNQLKIRPL